LEQDGNVTIWDAQTLKPLRHMDQPWGRLFESTSPRPIVDANPGYPEVSVLRFSPDGKQLAATGDWKEVCLWNVESGELEHELWIVRSDSSRCLAYSPDGALLAAVHDVAPEPRTVKLCDPQTGEIVASLIGHTKVITCLAFSPDGKTLASAGNDGIRFWNVATRERVGFLDDAHASFTSMHFSGDGKTLVAGDTVGRLHFWRAFKDSATVGTALQGSSQDIRHQTGGEGSDSAVSTMSAVRIQGSVLP